MDHVKAAVQDKRLALSKRKSSVTSVRLRPLTPTSDIESANDCHSFTPFRHQAASSTDDDSRAHAESSRAFFSTTKRTIRDAFNAFATGDPIRGVPDAKTTERERLAEERAEYDRQVVDLLDAIDPEVSTLSTLGDLQNSLFIPNLGRFVNRTRYLQLTRNDTSFEEDLEETSTQPSGSDTQHKRRALRQWLADHIRMRGGREHGKGKQPERVSDPRPALSEEERKKDIEDRGKYLILPKGLVDWDEWTPEERAELDDYVRHLLHSKKWKAKRTWRGFKQYVKTPLGAFVTIYASLLTFWGAAWVLFIIGWIPSGGRRAYFQEVCDQILTALFCLVGIGLAPFRAVDTYHMIFIAKYHRKTLRLYREQGAPALEDENDIPDPLTRTRTDPKQVKKHETVVRPPVLSVNEEAIFLYHQQRFAKSHTFYRPHETETHKAFPHDLLIVVVCLLDCHSLFQIALGSTTWSISYIHNFKHTLTAVILSFSICCNIAAGLVITVGNRRTRKTEVLEEMLRKAVTEEAVKRKEAKRLEAEERAAAIAERSPTSPSSHPIESDQRS